jgi:hypothetical protein
MLSNRERLRGGGNMAIFSVVVTKRGDEKCSATPQILREIGGLDSDG